MVVDTTALIFMVDLLATLALPSPMSCIKASSAEMQLHSFILHRPGPSQEWLCLLAPFLQDQQAAEGIQEYRSFWR